MKFDYLIVGAGITGATLARVLTDRGKKVLVIDKNSFIGGACYDKFYDDLPVCQFGSHSFHTKIKSVWEFVNRFSEFYPYELQVKSRIGNEYFPFPVNLVTLNKIFGITTPAEAQKYFKNLPFVGDNNYEEKAISTIGKELYDMFIYGYTKKQWGVEPKELPQSIFNRLPVRFNLDEKYFPDRYQGMPVLGHTNLITNMLKGIDCWLETPLSGKICNYKKLIYTGGIDSYYDYRFGKLDYRSIRHEYIIEDEDNFGGAIVSYPSIDVDFTRTLTFNYQYPHIKTNKFISVKEWATSDAPQLYPIQNKKNNDLYLLYKSIPTNTIFAGRLGTYRYINMDIAIQDAIELGGKL